MQSLVDAFPPTGEDPLARVALVVSDQDGAEGLAHARAAGIPTAGITFRKKKQFEAEVFELLDEHEIDLVCLAGFLRILSPQFVDRYPGRILNIHPSLLPKFRGLHPQAYAVAADETETGCTVHYVDAGIDTGEIILQRSVPIYPGDSVDTVADRILVEEHIAYPEAVRHVLQGKQ